MEEHTVSISADGTEIAISLGRSLTLDSTHLVRLSPASPELLPMTIHYTCIHSYMHKRCVELLGHFSNVLVAHSASEINLKLKLVLNFQRIAASGEERAVLGACAGGGPITVWTRYDCGNCCPWHKCS